MSNTAGSIVPSPIARIFIRLLPAPAVQRGGGKRRDVGARIPSGRISRVLCSRPPDPAGSGHSSVPLVGRDLVCIEEDFPAPRCDRARRAVAPPPRSAPRRSRAGSWPLPPCRSQPVGSREQQCAQSKPARAHEGALSPSFTGSDLIAVGRMRSQGRSIMLGVVCTDSPRCRSLATGQVPVGR